MKFVELIDLSAAELLSCCMSSSGKCGSFTVIVAMAECVCLFFASRRLGSRLFTSVIIIWESVRDNIMTHQQRRKNTRVAFHAEATVRVAGKIFERLAIKILSLRGIYIEGISGRSEGETCGVDIFLTGSSSELKLSMGGKVVRQDEHGVGVQFEDIELETFTHLKNIVQYNAVEGDQVDKELVGNISERS